MKTKLTPAEREAKIRAMWDQHDKKFPWSFIPLVQSEFNLDFMEAFDATEFLFHAKSTKSKLAPWN